MARGTTIARVRGRRVWDSRGFPAVEAEVTLFDGSRGHGIAPAAGLAAPGEPRDLRDGGAAFGGQDVTRAIACLDGEIARSLVGRDAADRGAVDGTLSVLDVTPDRGSLGSAGLYAASLAAANAAALSDGVPLWRHLARDAEPATLPMPRVQLFDCGLTLEPGNGIVGVSLLPVGAEDYTSALDWAAEVTRTGARMIDERGAGVVTAGPRGALRLVGMPAVAVLELAVGAIERAGFSPGEDLALALDVRAWRYGGRGRYRIDDGREIDTRGMIDRYLGWLRRYPVHSFADPLAADEIAGVAALAEAAGRAVEIAVGDGAHADTRIVRHLALENAGNALVVKPGQAVTLTAVEKAVAEARSAGWGAIIAARTGEGTGGALVHMAVAWGIGQLSAGGMARGERAAIWNEGLRLASDLPTGSAVPPGSTFAWG